MRRLRRLCPHQSGTSLIEFSMAAPMMALLLLGMADFAMAFSRQLQLEQAAARAIELASVSGRNQPNYDFVREEAATAAGVPLSAVTLDTWLECDGVRQALFSGNCANASAEVGRYVEVRITATFAPPFNITGLAGIFGGSGLSTMTLRGDSTVRVQ